ncbi:MAG: hypothetical protein ABI036_00150, partial [Fibrobacteria bacterium]
MLAYRKSDLDALAAITAIRTWADDGVLDAATAESLNLSFPPPFYSPNVFIRIGLFIFGAICALAALGLLFLMTNGWNSGNGFGTTLMVFGAGLAAGPEMLARRRKPFFRAGLEEAFTYGALISLLCGFWILIGFHGDLHYPLALFMGAIVSAAALRYVDGLLALAAAAFVFYAIFDLGSHGGDPARTALPFLIIALSAAVVYSAGWALSRPNLRYWHALWTVLRFATLMTGYAGGNYFVVKEARQAFLGSSFRGEEGIPMGAAFYAFTFCVPVIYIAWGLVRKDRLFLRAGLLCLALAVFTYKYYHHVMPMETGLTLVGIILITVAWFVLRIFKTVRFGITAERQEGSGRGLLDAESLAVLQSLASKNTAS